jgi:UDP-N-acetylglucosamine--N-acetylmuramyl-(pentapeptide) pyrophosphoryl-undecaprenol N-acetylglucosamine transferase
MRILIAGGGTGGHVIPALAIARELKSRYQADVLFVGTARGMEARLVPQAGFGLMEIKVGALKNVGLLTRLRTLLGLPLAILEARKILKAFSPDVVVGVGGYASGPAMAAAILAGIPTLAFEPNLVPGFANRVVGKRVSSAAVHFKETTKFFRNAQVVGVPVRSEFFAAPQSAAGPAGNHRPTLLVFGGSQGAHAINEAMTGAAPELLRRIPGLRVIHQTGERDYNDVEAAYIRAGASVEVLAFIDKMPEAYAQSDLLVCRSGASTVAEVTAAGKPSIFIPFPRAADDHQRRNAEAIVAGGAALMIAQTDLTAERLAQTVTELLSSPQRLKEMSIRARALAHADAAGRMARMVAELAGRERLVDP